MNSVKTRGTIWHGLSSGAFLVAALVMFNLGVALWSYDFLKRYYQSISSYDILRDSKYLIFFAYSFLAIGLWGFYAVWSDGRRAKIGAGILMGILFAYFGWVLFYPNAVTAVIVYSTLATVSVLTVALDVFRVERRE